MPDSQDNVLVVGETDQWAIKNFSVGLRQRIAQAARRHDCTVADFLHGHFQKYGVDGEAVNPVKLTPGSGGEVATAVKLDPGSAAPALPADLLELRALAELARLVTPLSRTDRDSVALVRARAMIAARLRALSERSDPGRPVLEISFRNGGSVLVEPKAVRDRAQAE